MFRTSLVSARALPDSDSTLHVPSDDGNTFAHLQSLLDVGLVTLVTSTDMHSEWRLSQSGLERLRYSFSVDRPRLVLALRDNVDVKDCTNWEFLCRLSLGGWEMKPAPQKQHRAALPPYVAGGPWLWYNSAVCLTKARPYITSLLLADDMFSQGTLVAVHHCQTPNYYKRVLTGKISGAVVQPVGQIADAALEPDGGEPLAIADELPDIGRVKKVVVRRQAPADAADGAAGISRV
jgi:hypothetical protein